MDNCLLSPRRRAFLRRRALRFRRPELQRFADLDVPFERHIGLQVATHVQTRSENLTLHALRGSELVAWLDPHLPTAPPPGNRRRCSEGPKFIMLDGLENLD